MKEVTLINLTPHAIVCGSHRIEPSGEIARVNAATIACGDVNGIPLFETRMHSVGGVPEEKPGVMYIVPTLIRQQFPHRLDLLSPAKLLRDQEGVVRGCLGLEVNPLKPIK